MQKFCHHCGKQVTIGANFCPSCGTSLSSLNAKPVAPAPTKSSQFAPFALGSEDDDDSYLDKMEHVDIRQTELHVEIVKDRPVGETLASVVAQGANTPPVIEDLQRQTPTIDKEAFLRDFKQEAGALRTHEKKHAVAS